MAVMIVQSFLWLSMTFQAWKIVSLNSMTLCD